MHSGCTGSALWAHSGALVEYSLSSVGCALLGYACMHHNNKNFPLKKKGLRLYLCISHS